MSFFKPLTLTFLLFLSFSVFNSPSSYAEKSKKNTKKADVKKISRGEHQIVKNWDSLHKKKVKKRQQIKKQFD